MINTSTQTEKFIAKPFIKWAGGKTQLISEIKELYPFNYKITKYIEPFVGGGAVLFNILNNYKMSLSDVFISDINAELINCYVVIRDNVNALIEELKKYKEEFCKLSKMKKNEYYYNKRTRFNFLKKQDSIKDKNDCFVYHIENNFSKYQIELAALFIFLNKTSFNGLYRENLDGNCNSPIGDNSAEICDVDNLLICSEKLKGCFICCCDFETAISFANEYCFVYIDPPYRPITNTSSFTAYTKNPFNDDEQKRLADSVYKLNDRKGRFILSNSDPHNVNEKDDFFDDLYSQFEIKRINARRNINSNATKRGKISELLIYNNKQ